MAKKAWTIGADPEFFLYQLSTGKVVPACGLIGGTKAKPIKINDDVPKGYYVQEDNVMLEFNVPPAKSASSFYEHITFAMVSLKDKLKPMGYSPHLTGEYFFPHSYLKSDQANTFGCSPDFNAHKDGQAFERINPKMLSEKNGAWRFAGGHIHLGYQAEIPHFVAASWADLFLGLPSIGIDCQEHRRNYYGQAGRYRPTPYGIEYRTLSNFWLSTENSINGPSFVALQAEYLLNYLTETSPLKMREQYVRIPWTHVQTAINTDDKNLKTSLLHFIKSDVGLSVGVY